MQKYKYKNSSIEWLGEIPEHWQVDRIKDRTIGVAGGDWGNDPDSDSEGENIVVFRVADLEEMYFRFEDLTIRKIKDSSFKSRRILPNSLIIEKSGGGEKQLVGRVGYPKGIDFDAICSNFMAKIDFGKTVDLLFMNYYFGCLYSNRLNFPFVQQTTGIQNLNVTYYLNTHIAFPPIKEQKAIAEYLDKACQIIDKAINIKKQQIESLEMHKESKLFELLTRGFDKKVKLKPSEINWINTIPENWKRKRVKDIVFLQSGNSITSEDINSYDTYPVYGGNGLRGYTSSYTHEGEFILIGRQGALCGNVNYANGKFWASEHAVVATPIKNFNTLWLGELLRVMNLNQYSNAAAQPGLAVEKIKNLCIPFPPIDIQNKIADYLKIYIDKNNKLANKLNEQLDNLKSYRKSIIHECVTGKKQVADIALEKEIKRAMA